MVETDGESLGTFSVRVINDGDRESLCRRIAGGPGESADRVLVIAAWRGDAVEDVAISQAGRIVGGIADGSAVGRVTTANNRQGNSLVALDHRIVRDAELDQLGGTWLPCSEPIEP